MDIEKALSEKDVQGLENCYKRIFNVSNCYAFAVTSDLTFPWSFAIIFHQKSEILVK